MAKAGNQKDPRVEEIVKLYTRLLACAVKLFKGRKCYGVDSVLPGTGSSPGDLASRTILKLMTGDQWRPGTGGKDIFPLAYVMLEHAFFDLIKSAGHRLTVITDSEEGEDLKEIASSESPYDDAAAKEQAGIYKRHFENDEMAKKFLDAIQKPGVETREDLALELNVTVQEVTNIQRRIQYKLHLIYMKERKPK